MMLLSLARAIPWPTMPSPSQGNDEGEDDDVGSGRRRGWGGWSSRTRQARRRSIVLLPSSNRVFVAVDDDVSLSLLRRGPGQAREWQNEMLAITRQPAGDGREAAQEWPLATKAAAVAATQQSTKKKGGEDALVVTAVRVRGGSLAVASARRWRRRQHGSSTATAAAAAPAATTQTQQSQTLPPWWCRLPLIRRGINGYARSNTCNLLQRGRAGGWSKRFN